MIKPDTDEIEAINFSFFNLNNDYFINYLIDTLYIIISKYMMDYPVYLDVYILTHYMYRLEIWMDYYF